jgi:hypothetical protein
VTRTKLQDDLRSGDQSRRRQVPGPSKLSEEAQPIPEAPSHPGLLQREEPLGDGDKEPVAQPLSLAFSDNDEVWVPGRGETHVTRTHPLGEDKPSPPASPSQAPDLPERQAHASAPAGPAGNSPPLSHQAQALPADSPAETEDDLEDDLIVAEGQYVAQRLSTRLPSNDSLAEGGGTVAVKFKSMT